MKFIILLVFTLAATSNATRSENIRVDLADVKGSASIGNLPDRFEEKYKYSKDQSCNINLATDVFRRMAPVGVNYDIPPIEPLNGALISPLQALNYSIDSSNIIIKGLQKYDLLQYVWLSPADHFPSVKIIDFALKLPKLVANGDVKIKSTKSNIKGNLRLLVEDIDIRGTMGLFFDLEAEKYVASAIELKNYFGHIEFDLEDIKSLSERSRLGKSLKDDVGDAIAEVVAGIIQKAVNDLMKILSAPQVHAFLNAKNTRKLLCEKY